MISYEHFDDESFHNILISLSSFASFSLLFPLLFLSVRRRWLVVVVVGVMVLKSDARCSRGVVMVMMGVVMMAGTVVVMEVLVVDVL